ncbi:MAG: Mur ligase domain-containing protein, partial [Ruthenibacterium sp.]
MSIALCGNGLQNTENKGDFFMQSIAANTLLRGLGTLVDNPVLTGVVTDSRAVKQGSLFVCIAGERVDGHAYAKQ